MAAQVAATTTATGPERRCYGYFVPDREAQRQLEELGFCLAAPKQSFDPISPPPPVGKCFGGAHVSVLKPCKFSPGCSLDQLRAAADLTRRWRAPAMTLDTGGHQATVRFECSLLAAAASAAADAGWAAGVVRTGFHVGLYNTTLEEKLTRKQAEAMVDCLQNAGWGWVLAIDDGKPHKVFKFDWETFIPSTAATAPAPARVTLCNTLSQRYLHTR
jgi:hypothetical protein